MQAQARNLEAASPAVHLWRQRVKVQAAAAGCALLALLPLGDAVAPARQAQQQLGA